MENTLWMLRDPQDVHYASAMFCGTWQYSLTKGICKECTASGAVRVSPLIMNWEAGSSEIGDFTWDGVSEETAITADALRKLQSLVEGCSAGAVQMIQSKRLKRPQRPNRRTKPRVWLPYDGPPLYELIITKRVHVDMDRSSIRLRRKCSTCGIEFYKLWGVEHSEVLWSPQDGAGVMMRHPRKENCGLYVPRQEVPGATLFRVHEWPSWIVCTDAARTAIEELELTNVTFREAGEVF